MLNIRTLLPSTQLLSEIIEEREIDIMSLTETNLNEDTPNENISIENYNIIRVDRDLNFSNKIKGGGVLLYIKNHLKYKIIEQGTQNKIEQVWCVVTLPKSEKLGIGIIYRPPSVSYTELSCIENQLENLVPQVDHMIIAGDFNVDYSKQVTLGYKFLKQTLDPYNVTQIINLPTRTTSNTSTIIDHIYVSHSLVSPEVYVEDMSQIRNRNGNSLSDHNLIYFHLPFLKPAVKIATKKHIRCFSKINIDALRYDAKALSFDAIKDTNGVNVKISLFNEEVSSLFNQHAPLKSVTSKRAKPEWLTHNISEMIKARRKAYNAFNRTRAQEKWRF
jgi:hypothetical protein